MFRPLVTYSRNRRPKWARHISPEDFKLFSDLVIRSSKGVVNASQSEDDGTIAYGDAQINIANLYNTCSRLSKDLWDEEIAQWFQAFKTTSISSDQPQQVSLDQLKLQFYPKGYFDGMSGSAGYLTREDLPGVLTTVVVDRPDRVIAMTKTALGKLATHSQETFAHLISELSLEKAHTINYVKLNGSDELIAAILGDDIMTATHVLALEKLYPHLLGKTGALVGVPHRHMILAKKMDSEPSRALIAAFHNMVRFMVKDQPGFISDDVFLLKGKKFQKLS